MIAVEERIRLRLYQHQCNKVPIFKIENRFGWIYLVVNGFLNKNKNVVCLYIIFIKNILYI